MASKGKLTQRKKDQSRSGSQSSGDSSATLTEEYLSEEFIKSFLPKDNDAPRFTDSEETSLRRDRRQRQEILADRKNEIIELRRRLRSLEAEVVDIQEGSAHYQHIFDPVRILPTEILQKIYLHARDAQSPGEMNSLDIMTDPWRVSHVSRKWRVAALSYPALWNMVHVRFIPCPPPQRQFRAYLLSIFLSRSGLDPLYMTLTSRIDLDESLPVLAPLLGSAHRWKTLTVDISPRNFLILSPLRPHLTCLKKFTLVDDAPMATWADLGVPGIANASLLIPCSSENLLTLQLVQTVMDRRYSVTRILSKLSLTRLDELRVESKCATESPFHLDTFFKQCKIRRLYLSCPHAPLVAENLVSIMTYLHYLELLEIHTNGNDCQSVEELMTELSTSPALLFRLDCLTVIRSNPNSCIKQSVVKKLRKERQLTVNVLAAAS